MFLFFSFCFNQVQILIFVSPSCGTDVIVPFSRCMAFFCKAIFAHSFCTTKHCPRKRGRYRNVDRRDSLIGPGAFSSNIPGISDESSSSPLLAVPYTTQVHAFARNNGHIRSSSYTHIHCRPSSHAQYCSCSGKRKGCGGENGRLYLDIGGALSFERSRISALFTSLPWSYLLGPKYYFAFAE